MSIIERITQIMDTKNLNQSDLCKMLGIKDSTFSTWKTRGTDPPAKYILLICEYLGVSVDYLLGRVDEPDKYLKITYPIDPTEKGIKLSSSNSKPKNNTQFDETTTQVAEMFSKLNLVDKTKVLSLMVELSQAQTKEEPQQTIKISASDGKPPKVVTKETLDKIEKATDITDNY